ncbi:probable leucine-rich repeat receptor-like serine/threonine-protein kinase At3g14840 [Mercurialis annua]|uniref:probable leucine-rich repeat receptor-like serine/threonine-protein kinase At3g14840 n=1 Tax=Mercurialis annua TaxID=3986 RepID=UPI00215F5E08|nr:probable leucine-rich repeat receptor-like serine/threonine-protein kinase At3g14840 [Mercurialis annua]
MFSPTLPFVCMFCLITLVFGAAKLPNDEVEGLREIGKIIGKTWNFSVDPCSTQSGWLTLNPVKGFENAVTCNCSFQNATICHVISIVVKSQSLQGTLPKDFSRLPFLQEIDFTRNYLNGTIPSEWGSTKFVNISLIGNRLSGPIPKELGNITSLTSFTAEYNQLSGELPQELGNLPAIQRILLSSNNLTGQLPATFTKLTTLKDFRIADNQFKGPIPNLIQNWTNLEKLVIQGSGLSGPIPSSILLLKKMTDLRISDLSNGTTTPFPPLSNMINLKTLICRSCNIVGKLPEYLGAMTKLKVLDLSFNKLSGEIPSTFSGLANTDYIYLTGNQLTGRVPDWMLKRADNIDLSYNNLASQSSCQQGSVNLFASSSMGNLSSTVSCLTSFHCPKNFYSFHINCGGKEGSINGIRYEDDTNPGGPSIFHQSRTNWAFSSTGHFLDNERQSDPYISTNTTKLSPNTSALYTDARLSPLSLTYYGFCMGNGNYTVSLHFAEIMFTNDNTYSSLGRRMFDIYIQGKLVQKDFNIAEEAGGVGKAIMKNYTTIITNGTLEIRFYCNGKGTTGIPVRGVYGPLISAISVTSDFKPPSENSKSSSSISIRIVIGIVGAVVAIICFILGVLWWKGCLRRKDKMVQDLEGLDLQTGSFSLKQIKAATNNFDPLNKIGEGGFGSVYKGRLLDGTTIAVKQLSEKSRQGNREFVTEIGMISALQHPHLVKLYGCCIEANQLLLVYEYMDNNSLARALFGPEECRLNLDWPTRHKICVGIARGLAFLHEESRLKIVHRDIKATNVLLDKDLNPKISDFGLAKLDEEENTHISTRVAGTFGYMAPEYAMRGHLTDKADVYSFGIVALEIVSGRSNTSFRHNTKEDCFYLLDWAHVLKEKGSLIELVDQRMGSNYDKEEVLTMIKVALQCSSVSSAARPSMSSVVSMLEGKTVVEDLASSESYDETKIEAMRKHFQNAIETPTSTQSMSMDGPWTASSTSARDLYPVPFDSQYWDTRN